MVVSGAVASCLAISAPSSAGAICLEDGFSLTLVSAAPPEFELDAHASANETVCPSDGGRCVEIEFYVISGESIRVLAPIE